MAQIACLDSEQLPAVSALDARFGYDIEGPLRVARAKIADLVFEVMVDLYPEPARRTITADDLRASGFDPANRAPDPADYI